MTFDECFEKLIGHEGGFDENPKDRGNWTSGACGVGMLRGTKYGISAMAYPGLDIKNLTLQQAKDIYARDYWAAAGCTQAPAAVVYTLFDLAVNSGPDAAVKCLQRAVGAQDDGIIGRQTLALMAQMPQHQIAARVAGHRLKIMANVPSAVWQQFGRGWALRVSDILVKV